MPRPGPTEEISSVPPRTSSRVHGGVAGWKSAGIRAHMARSRARRAGAELASRVLQKGVWLRSWVNTSLSAPLMLMYFLMLLMNTILRDTKDTLLVTSAAGVEAIPILKSWVVIPFSFAYFLMYYKLSKLLDSRQLFICVLFMFNAFYLVFAVVLYPRREALVPRALTEALGAALPPNARPLQHLVENWLFGLFYCVSELYASAVCQFMFWQVANNVVSLEEAKAVYPLVGATGNLGMVCAGYMLRAFANQRDVVAAHAYLRVKGGGALPASAQASTASSSPDLGEAGDLYVNSLGYSIFSKWLLPFTGDQMEPLDQAWQGTLLGTSLLLGASTVLMLVAYDSLHERKELEKEQEVVAAAEKSRSQSATAMPESSSSHHDSNQKVKRRTGSGNEMRAVATSAAAEPVLLPVREQWPLNGDGGSGREAHGGLDSSAALRRDSEGALKKARKPQLSLWEGLRALSSSTPLRCAATLVVSYGVSISLVEVSWKGQVKKALGSPNDYSRFMGMFWTLTGLVSMLFMLVGRIVLQRVGYGPAVLFTPASMAIAGTLFFIVSIAQDLANTGAPQVGAADASSIAWAAYFGGAAVLFAKSAKYAFFDATKEIIFIPLDENSKSLGKAAIDVVAYRLSKSGGSVVLQIVIILCGSVSTTAGILPIAIIFGLVVFAWIHAAITANQFISRTTEALPEQHIV